IEAGYLVATPAEDWKLPASQTGFVALRGSIWGRLLALRLTGTPRPPYRGFAFFKHWLLRVDAREQVKSVAGARKRVRARELKRRHEMVPMDTQPAPAPRAPEKERVPA